MVMQFLEVLYDATKFLEVLYDATNILSGVYYPTTPLLVHKMYFLADHLKAHENDPKLREVVKK